MSANGIKESILAVFAVVGGAIATAFGGWSAAMLALIIAMSVDYVTGLVVAMVFKTSPKTESGAASSDICYKGLLRKGGMLLIVLIAAQVDKMMGTTFVRDAVILYFVANEGLSILENAGYMGIRYPEWLKNMLESMQEKSGEKKETGK